MWCGLLRAFPLYVCGAGRAGSGPGLLRPSPWELRGRAQWVPLQARARRIIPPSLCRPRGFALVGQPPPKPVTHLLFCHPLCKPTSVLLFLFFVNNNKV